MVSLQRDFKRFLIGLLFIILLYIRFWDTIEATPIIQLFLKHVDELLTILMLLYVVLNFQYLYLEKKSLIIAASIFYFVGVISTVIFHYQPMIASIMDFAVICDRFFLGYLSAFIFCKKNKYTISKFIEFFSRISAILLFVLCVVDMFIVDLFPKADVRMGFASEKLFFPHPTFLATAACTILISLGYSNRRNRNLVWMLMSSFVVFSTERSKALGFVLVYWMMYILIFVYQNKSYLLMIFGGAIGAIVIAMDEIQDYFLNTERFSPRSVMMKDGFSLMLKHFPLGTGYATYGSSLAADYYSPLYDMLGYENNWGMSRDFSAFLTDGFWPIIMAQFGFIGLIAFIWMVIYWVRLSTQKLKTNQIAGFSMLMTMVYFLIMSIAESSFFSPVSLLPMMLFAVYELER